MADNLTNEAENAILDHILGVATYTITGPMKLALTTTVPTDSAAGTEVTGGSYARATLTFSAASGGAITSSAAVTITDMPACNSGGQGTIKGWNIYDSTGTPKRVWYGTLTEKTVNAGDTFEIAIGDIDLSIS